MLKLADKRKSREERVCPWWLAWTFDNPLRRFLHDPQEMLGPQVREGMIAADIGCSMGYFSVALARMVGRTGSVIAVDLQQKMLDICCWRAQRAGVADRIRTVLATSDDIKFSEHADLVLAFWMVHEVQDIPRFFSQVEEVLKPGGKVLYAEPKMHVTRKRFEEILGHASDAGLRVSAVLNIGLSRAVLLARS